MNGYKYDLASRSRQVLRRTAILLQWINKLSCQCCFVVAARTVQRLYVIVLSGRSESFASSAGNWATRVDRQAAKSKQGACSSAVNVDLFTLKLRKLQWTKNTQYRCEIPRV